MHLELDARLGVARRSSSSVRAFSPTNAAHPALPARPRALRRNASSQRTNVGFEAGVDGERAAAGRSPRRPSRHHARRRQRVREARAHPARVPARGAVPGAAALEHDDVGPARSELVGAAQPDDPAADDDDLHAHATVLVWSRGGRQALAGARKMAGRSTGIAVRSAALVSSASSVKAATTDSLRLGRGRAVPAHRGGEALELQAVRDRRPQSGTTRRLELAPAHAPADSSSVESSIRQATGQEHAAVRAADPELVVEIAPFAALDMPRPVRPRTRSARTGGRRCRSARSSRRAPAPRGVAPGAKWLQASTQ